MIFDESFMIITTSPSPKTVVHNYRLLLPQELDELMLQLSLDLSLKLQVFVLRILIFNPTISTVYFLIERKLMEACFS